MIDLEFFIAGNVPSSKDGLRPIRGRIVPSKLTLEYRKDKTWDYHLCRDEFIRVSSYYEKPLKVGFYFYRKSRHRFDYINATQIIQDMMVKHGWLPDDNSDELHPYFIGYEHHKEKPGVKISLLVWNNKLKDKEK